MTSQATVSVEQVVRIAWSKEGIFENMLIRGALCRRRGCYSDGLWEEYVCVGGWVANWAVYTTIYKALIMQKADPTQQSPNWPYYIVLGFFSPRIGWPTADFSVVEGQQYKKGPHSGPLLRKRPESGSPEESVPTQSWSCGWLWTCL